ncbi:MAG: ubiquinone/menaquinone biosynthesis methyltransferase [Gemmatimonadota bacterium]|nr:ubiquinone/menaquinone biosynthesis methyltransferase [Gemmatimonadota bacterium]MDE2984823.1 ubiquinone/menaquinone biosynthesis methyltransferase [Gemmatimonadota bacterium]
MTASPKAEPAGGRERAAQVRTLFSEIAHRYDLLNHVLSLNIDRRWRHTAVGALDWEREPGGTYLDACAGTLDLAHALVVRPGFHGRVVGADFALPMLAGGLSKIGGHPVDPVCGDTQRLPFRSGSFAGAMVGFGVRNLSDLETGFGELHRVLEPGGRLVILEFTVPPGKLLRAGYLVYFNHILPLVGRVVSGHPWAYSYLPRSVPDFPGPDALAELLRGAGFDSVEWRLVSRGIAAIHVAAKGPGAGAGDPPPGS